MSKPLKNELSSKKFFYFDLVSWLLWDFFSQQFDSNKLTNMN